MNWTECATGCQDDSVNNINQNSMPTTRTRSRNCFASDGVTYLESHDCRGNDVDSKECAVERCKNGRKGNKLMTHDNGQTDLEKFQN